MSLFVIQTPRISGKDFGSITSGTGLGVIRLGTLLGAIVVGTLLGTLVAGALLGTLVAGTLIGTLVAGVLLGAFTFGTELWATAEIGLPDSNTVMNNATTNKRRYLSDRHQPRRMKRNSIGLNDELVTQVCNRMLS
jgi:hypothetical protein